MCVANYCPWPGLVTGGRLFRNSACCRSASRWRSNSRVCSSGLGLELAQPDRKTTTADARNRKPISFFITNFIIVRLTDPAIGPANSSRFRLSDRRDLIRLVFPMPAVDIRARGFSSDQEFPAAQVHFSDSTGNQDRSEADLYAPADFATS